MLTSSLLLRLQITVLYGWLFTALMIFISTTLSSATFSFWTLFDAVNFRNVIFSCFRLYENNPENCSYVERRNVTLELLKIFVITLLKNNEPQNPGPEFIFLDEWLFTFGFLKTVKNESRHRISWIVKE